VSAYPAWLFDDSPLPDPHGMGEKAVAFIRNLKHPKSAEADKAFRLDAWQERIIRRVYGDTDGNGRRRIKSLMLLTGKGARKTTLMGAIGALHLLSPDFRSEHGSIIAAAADKDQASLAFDEAADIIRAHGRTNAACIIREAEREIEHLKSSSTFTAVSSDAAGKHGLSPTVVLADEIAVWTKPALWKALRTALVKTPGSLCLIATNAGAGQESIGWELYAYARKVAEGAIKDPSFLPILCENPADADWRNEATWHRANPGLKMGYPDLEGLRTLAREAENRPSERADFQRFNLSMWQDGAAAAWLEPGTWDALAHDSDESAFEGLDCWIGVDLASKVDLAAVVACIPHEGRFHVFARVFTPARTLRRKADIDHIPAELWAEQGHLIATPGAVIDEDAIEEAIRDFCSRFNVREIAFDPWSAKRMMTRLQEDSLPVVEMRQGLFTMAPATAEFEKQIIAGNIATDGNPVLRWCVQNVRLTVDKADNKQMTKAKSTGRIDAAVAACMAVARASYGSGEAAGSIYDDAEARPSGFLFI
jgi:phage terminase large subunit-like protein